MADSYEHLKAHFDRIAEQNRNDREAVRAQRDELLAALKALADRVDATSECDHKRISCEDIGCIGAEVRRARVAIAKVERK